MELRVLLRGFLRKKGFTPGNEILLNIAFFDNDKL